MNSKDYRSILLNVYEQHHPEKMKDVKELLSKYKGQEEQLLQAVYEKYNIPPKDRSALETPNNVVANVSLENIHAQEQPTITKPNKTIWVVGCIILLLIGGGVWYSNSQDHLDKIPQEEQAQETALSASTTPNLIDATKKYPSLVLEDLKLLRVHPDQTSHIEEKGYHLISSKENTKTYVGTLGDTVIVNKKWINDITKVSWRSGVNRKWLYNHMRDEIRRIYTYSDMLSNTDESDNEIEGLRYFKDECYWDDKGIYYRTYVIYLKNKIIGYEVEINESY